MGLVSVRPAQAQLTDNVVHNFGLADGTNPRVGLIQATDGNYYGVTQYGGSGNGTVFKWDGTSLKTLHIFTYSDGSQPLGTVAQGSDGALYGTTFYGGSSGYGVIYKVNTDGSGFSVLHNFSYSDGANSQGDCLAASDGSIYGSTDYGGAYGDGMIFKINIDGSGFTDEHDFSYSDGYIPYGNLLQGLDGNLYGATIYGGSSGYGVVFQLVLGASPTLNVLHNFSYSDGAYPNGCAQGADGTLYVATDGGGANGYANIVKMGTDGSNFTDLHDFNYSDGEYPTAEVTFANDGNLYGTCLFGGSSGYGVVFQINTTGSVFNVLHNFAGNPDGAYVYGRVIQGTDGRLHGTTYYSSYTNPINPYAGTIYSVDTGGVSFSTDFDFANGFHDGRGPNFGTLTLGKDGNYYGTTFAGGSANYGALYKMTPGGQVTILVNFNGYDGYQPYNSVTFDKAGNIYGSTSGGGIYGSGNIWEYSPATNTVTDLFDFGTTAGYFLTGNIIVSGTKIYGTATQGGEHNDGALWVVQLPTATTPGTFTLLHSFNYTDGAFPFGSLIVGTDKFIYGCCNGGGANGSGTIFKATTKGVITTLHSLSGSTDGAYPNNGVIEGSDGLLYGGTYLGGANGDGTVYSVSRDGATFNLLHTFNGSDGSGAVCDLLQGSDGMIWGTTYAGGANGSGTAFQMSTNGSVFNSLYSFGAYSGDGTTPYAGLKEGPDGNMYVATDGGGLYGGGAAVQLATQLPLIKSVGPTTAVTGQTITIKGVNLAAPTSVTIGGVAQTILSSTATQIKIAAVGPASGPVVVTTGHGVGYSAKSVTVN